MNYRDKAVRAFCKLRRLQEANEAGYVRCITCGRIMKWNECDGGHFIHRRFRATEVEPDNVWPQCIACNRFGNLSLADYGERLAEKIGWERVNRLLKIRYSNTYRKNYQQLAKEFESEARRIREEKCL
jgi:hypothetical protein